MALRDSHPASASPVAARAAAAGLALLLGSSSLVYGGTRTAALYWIFALALICALGTGIAGWWRRGIAGDAGVLALGALLLAGVALQPTLQARETTHLALGWCALVLGRTVGDRIGAARALLRIVAGFGVLQALLGILQSTHRFADLRFQTLYPFPTGTLINPNHYAGLLAMTAPIAVLAFLRPEAGRTRRNLGIALGAGAALIHVLAISLTRSKGGTLALTAGAITLAAIGWSRRNPGWTRRHGAVALTCTVLVLATVSGLLIQADMLQEGGRLATYRDTLRMIADRPWTGVWPDSYRWRFPSYQTENFTDRYDHAHNEYLQSAAEWGVPVALLFWGWVGWWAWRSSKRAVSSDDPSEAWAAAAISASVVAALAHAAVDFNLRIPTHLVLFAALVGIASRTWPRPSRTPRTGRLRPLAALLILGLAGFALGRVSLRYTAFAIANLEEPPASWEKAQNFDRSNPLYALKLGTDASRSDPRDGDAARHFQRAIELNPWNPAPRMELGRVLIAMGRVSEARRQFRRASELAPWTPEPAWALAELEVASGDPGAATQALLQAVARDEARFPRALDLLQESDATSRHFLSLAEGVPGGRPALLRWAVNQPDREKRIGREALDSLWRSELQNVSRKKADARLLQLARRGELDEFDRWRRQIVGQGSNATGSSGDGNRVWNGDFSADPSGSRFDWSFGRCGEGGAVALERRRGSPNTLRLDLVPERRSDCLSQWLALDPGEKYVFSFESLREPDPTGEALHWEFRQLNRGEVARFAVPETSGWNRSSYPFMAPDDSAVLELRLRPSRRFGGSIRIREVRLDTAPPSR